MRLRIAITLLVLWSVGCEADDALTIFAASSLTDAFSALGERWKAENRGASVEFNFAGSQALRTQIEHGAPADVFAAANPEHIGALQRDGLVDEPHSFARNALAVATPAPGGVESFEELPDAESIVVGHPDVPVGRYTETLLERADARYGGDFAQRVTDAVASRESNVRLVLARVAMGEADAAVVYRSDVVAAGDDVRFVPIPESVNVAAEYRVAAVRDSASRALADSWITFLRREQTGEVLRENGFLVDGGAR